MPIQFHDRGSARSPRVPILKITEKRTVVLLGDSTASVQVKLHWLPGGSVPCYGDECKNCSRPPVLYGYAPCAVMMVDSLVSRTRHPEQAILPVTAAAFSLLEEDLRGWFIDVWRTGGRPNGEMRWKKSEKSLALDMGCFDVLPHLLKLWGSRLNAIREVDIDVERMGPATISFGEVG